MGGIVLYPFGMIFCGLIGDEVLVIDDRGCG